MELTALLLQTSRLLNQPCSLSFGLVDLLSLRGDVELKEHDVAVLDNVLLSFLSVQAGSFHFLFGPMLEQVVVRLHLSHDESVFEIGMDDTGSSWGHGSVSDSPALDLVLTSREVVDELKSAVARVHNLVDHCGCANLGSRSIASSLLR